VELSVSGGAEMAVDLAGDVPFQAAHDLFLGQTFGGAPLDVGAGRGWELIRVITIRHRAWLACRSPAGLRRSRLNPPKKPDYLIRTAAGEVAAEVKSFESWGLFENLQDGMFAMQSVTKTLKPVRDRIAKAAAQLKGINGRPLVVVLDNPGNRMPLSPANVIFAMYGDPEFVFPADRAQPGFWHTSRNGELHMVNDHGAEHGSHAHPSAVAVLREQPAGARLQAVTMDVFETMSGHCVTLPAAVFAHEGDRRWGVLRPGQYGLRSDLTQ
jgi:hypothetical protein